MENFWESEVRKALFKTKYALPKLNNKNILNRENLFSRLNSSYFNKLTYISAPAGSGKTTLISEWVKYKNISKDIFFISLDNQDNDISNFFFYFLKAFDSITNSNYIRIDSEDDYDVKYYLNLLVDKLSSIQKDLFIIIDDYHYILNSNIHNLLCTLIDKSPNNLHFIILSRSEIPYNFSKLRLHSQLLDISLFDLKLNRDEIKNLFQINSLTITEKEILVIEEKTEGWLLSIEMMILSLKMNPDKNILEKTIHINNKYLLDFFTDQILSTLDKNIIDFITKTSILKKFDSSICNKILNINNSQQILEFLEKNNIFIINIDSNRVYFRYHNLFSEIISNRLRLENNNTFSDLCKNVSLVYKNIGFYQESIEYAFLSQDNDFIALIIEQQASLFIKNVESIKLLNIIEKLPQEVILSNNILSIFYSIVLSYKYNIQKSETILNKVESKLRKDSCITDNIEALIYFAYLSLYLRCSNCRNKVVKYLKLFSNKIFFIDENLITVSYLELSRAFFISWNLKKSLELVNKALSITESSKDLLYSISIRRQKYSILSINGDLNKAEILLKEIIDDLEKYDLLNHKLAIFIFKDISRIYYQWNKIDLFDKYTAKAIKILDKTDNKIYMIDFYYFLVFPYLKLRRKDDFEFLFNKEVELIETTNSDVPLKTSLDTLYINYLITFDKVKEIPIEWEKDTKEYINEKISSNDPLNLFEVEIVSFQCLVLSKFYILKNSLKFADKLLDLLFNIMSKTTLKLVVIQIYILKSIIKKKEKNIYESTLLLKNALSLAQKSNYISVFLEYKEDIYDLLTSIVSSDNESNKSSFESIVLNALEDNVDVKQKGSLKKVFNPLSKKEVEILKLVSLDLSNNEILDREKISLNTLKTHLKHIFKKLNVKNRKEAVKKISELGIKFD